MPMTLSRRLPWPLAILLLVLCLPAGAADLYYLGQKLPDLQRPWGSPEYQQLIEALERIDKTQANALPAAAASSPGRSTSAWSMKRTSSRS